MEYNDHEDDKIYDNIIRSDQELIKANSPIEEYSSYLNDHYYTSTMNDNPDQEEEEEEEKQLCQSPPIPLISSLVKTRSNNLTEIDEDDFFYQGPSPYVTTINHNSIPEKIEESIIIPSYKIDEYVDEDDTDERDHVKELEETIANISRHFPGSSEQVNDTELNSIEINLHQPSNLSVGKIDIDSILEMEIESPSIDEHYLQSSKSIHLPITSSQPPLNIPISVPISVHNRRGSLSRSSGIRENLTDLLVTTTIEPYPTNDRPLHRTSSTHSKVDIFNSKKNNIMQNSRQAKKKQLPFAFEYKYFF
jgi:hypothetical protein